MIAEVKIGERAIGTDSIKLIKISCLKALKLKGSDNQVLINGERIKDVPALVNKLKELSKQVFKKQDMILVGGLKDAEKK